MIRAGSTQDPPHLLGLANLTAELLTQGTTQRKATQISREIESVGGSLSASGESDYAALNLSILKKDLPLGLSILSDILLNPLFAPPEIERKVSELKARLKRMDEEPRQVARMAFSKKLFGTHPYAHPTGRIFGNPLFDHQGRYSPFFQDVLPAGQCQYRHGRPNIPGRRRAPA